MTITATYNSDISRVQLVFSGFSAAVDYAKVERLDPNGVTWSVIRGGDVVAVTSGAGAVDDFEFVPNVLNTYRVSGVDSALPQFQTVGAASTGNNASLTPAAPSGLIDGDLKLIMASIRNNGTGVCGPAPTGWTTVYSFQNVAVYGKRHVTGDANPTVTFTGGAAGSDTIAQMARFTNSEMAFAAANQISNSSAQNVNVPSIVLPSPTGQLLYLGWKQVTLTSTTTPAFATKIADVPSAAGTGASMFWDWFSSPLGNGGVTFPGQSITVTGGSAAISIGVALTFNAAAFVTQQTATVTPTFAFDEYWLKNPSRPGLNIKVQVTEIGDITRPARTGTFPVLGRTVPVAVTDVQGSRQFSLEIFTDGESNATDMDNRLSTGEPMLLQGGGPTDLVPTVYFVAGDIVNNRPAKGHTAHTFTIPVTEVARPGNTVYGLTYVWQDVINNYADWNAVLAATPDWSSLINKVSNTVVIVS